VGRGGQNKACVGKKKKKSKYKRENDCCTQWVLGDLVSGIDSAANLLCDLGLVFNPPWTLFASSLK
jgi:hypothetical protein